MDELVEVLTVEFGDSCTYEDFVIWHTHPSGHVGPSLQDLRHRLFDLHYFVVALPNGEGAMF